MSQSLRRLAAPFCALVVVNLFSGSAAEAADPAPPEVTGLVSVGSPFVISGEMPGTPGTISLSINHAALAAATSAASASNGVILENVPLAPLVTRSLLVRPIAPRADLVVEVKSLSGEGALVTQTLSEDELTAAWGTLFAGKVLGEENSMVLLSFGPAGTFGVVEHDDHRFVISSGRFGAALPLLAYDEHTIAPELRPDAQWSCTVAEPTPDDADAHGDGTKAKVGEGVLCRQFSLALESDFEYLQLFGGDPIAATNYAILLITAASEISATGPDVRLGLTYLRLWSTPADPWTGATPGVQLTDFRNHWNAQMTGIDRDIAHFLSGRPLGGGSAWVGKLCTSAAYSLASNLNGAFPYPLVDNNPQNWDVFIVTHEIAHVYGAIHTHEHGLASPDLCGWGECLVGQNATIMSYCHLCPGGVSNIKLEFAPISIATILTYLAGTTLCVPPSPLGDLVAVDDTASAVSGATITIDLLANDEPANCGPVDLASVAPSSVEGGSIVVGADPGTVEYTAPVGFIGQDSFAYTISGAGLPAVGQAFIWVTAFSADLNEDGHVDGADLALILGGWGSTAGIPADLNDDGIVDGSDLALVLGAWTG